MNEVLEKIQKIGIVPVVVLDDAKDAAPLAKALCEGGLPCAEVTFRTAAAEESIRIMAKEFPDMLVGAGTVLTTEQVDRAVNAGAKFIVSPGLNPTVVKYCVDKGIPVTPGTSNPSDVEMAISLGLDVVKFFPAEQAGGINMIKAMAAPYTQMKFMPTGGSNRRAARMQAAALRWLVRMAALLTAAVLVFLIGYILVMGIPNLKPELFAWEYNSENVSLTPALINTVLMTAFSLAISTPLGIFAAIWLVEYAHRGSKLVKVVRVTTETLQGIPSIVYGLFGMLFFVTKLHWGYSMIAGAFTLAIMVLPVIMRTTEEALIAVPDSYREGSFGLGAGKLRTVFTIVLPSAMPGILSGVILATGRIVGETAALIYTASSVAKIPSGVFSSTRTLAVHMYLLSNEGLYIGQTYGTAVVLLVLVLVINGLSGLAADKLAKR